MSVKLLIGIPNYRDSVTGRFLDCFARLAVHAGRTFAPGELQYMRVGITFIDIARNAIWLAAQKCGAENLLFLDDDMTFTPEMFDALRATSGDIVSALCFVRAQPPTRPAMFRRRDDGHYESILSYQQNTVMPVDATGLAFTLIRKPVLDALEAPFTRESSKGEDITFCERARAAGFTVAVNTGVKVGHLFTFPFEINETNAGGAMEDLYRAMDPAAPPVPNGYPRPE